jgi:tRNA-Thr(GGU) m(6)t(6)A37 methyltransferase TsaA
MQPYTFVPIGKIHSCFTQKFGIPRQPRLVPQARAVLEIVPPFHQKEAFKGLEHFSHVWILFIFHQCRTKSWNPTVRPPRLGGNRRMGVFATRSGYRPTPIGQSAVALEKIIQKNGGLHLHLAGVDFLDGTPVLDIKPYLPYSDIVSEALGGYAHEAPSALKVNFSAQAQNFCRGPAGVKYPDLEALAAAVVAQDPRPGYVKPDATRCYGMRLWDLNIRFSIDQDKAMVETITPLENQNKGYTPIER